MIRALLTGIIRGTGGGAADHQKPASLGFQIVDGLSAGSIGSICAPTRSFKRWRLRNSARLRNGRRPRED